MNPGTGLLFDGQIIAAQGLAPVSVIPATGVPAMTASGAATVKVNAGSSLPGDSAVVVPGGNLEAQMGLTQLDKGMNIIGSGGFNAALRQNVESFKLDGLGGFEGLAGPMR